MAVTDPVVPPPMVGTQYDARRGIYYRKPVLRGWLHLLWFAVSLVSGTLLVAHAQGAARTAASGIYAASVSGLFGASALYHRGNWPPAWHRRLQRLDQVMIFFLIAGTATPALLLADGPWGLVCLAVLWALTLTAAVIRMVRLNVPERMAGAIFLGLGWLAALALPGLWIHAGVGPAALMLSGGVLYTIGAVLYHRRWPDPRPSVFGYHEVFHVFVCAAATCQFAAIAMLVS